MVRYDNDVLMVYSVDDATSNKTIEGLYSDWSSAVEAVFRMLVRASSAEYDNQCTIDSADFNEEFGDGCIHVVGKEYNIWYHISKEYVVKSFR